ncbi:MAG: ribosomal protein S5 domain 2-type protein, partial [Olpidium bornovanus]
MAPSLISPAEKDYIVRGAAADTRADGRARLDTRQITLETGVISHASGSARLRVQGGTDVLVGVKVEAGLPELVESDGSTLAKGDRGRLVVSVLDYGGNLLDTTLLAARSALHNARVPVTIVQDLGDGSGAVDFEIDDDVENAQRLKGWEDVPLGVTLCTMRLEHTQGEDEEQREDDDETGADGEGGRRKDNAPVGQLYLADCTPLEELSASARIFVAFNRQGRVVA